MFARPWKLALCLIGPWLSLMTCLSQVSSNLYGCQLGPTGDRVACIRYRYRIGDNSAALQFVVYDLQKNEVSVRDLDRTEVTPTIADVSPDHKAFVYSSDRTVDYVTMSTANGSSKRLDVSNDGLGVSGWTRDGSLYVFSYTRGEQTRVSVFDANGSLVQSTSPGKWAVISHALSADRRILYLAGEPLGEDSPKHSMKALDLGSGSLRDVSSLDRSYIRLEHCDGKEMLYSSEGTWFKASIDGTNKAELGKVRGIPNWLAKKTFGLNTSDESVAEFSVVDLTPEVLASYAKFVGATPSLIPAGVAATAKRAQEYGKSASATEGYVWEFTITNGTGKKEIFEYSVSKTLEDYWFQGPIEIESGQTKKVDVFVPHSESPDDPSKPIVQIRVKTEWTGEWTELADGIYWNYWHNGRELVFGVKNRGQGKVKADVTFSYEQVGDSRRSATENTSTMDGSGDPDSVWRLHRSVTHRGKPPVKVTEFKIHGSGPSLVGTWDSNSSDVTGTTTFRSNGSFRATGSFGEITLTFEGDFKLAGEKLTMTHRSLSGSGLPPESLAILEKELIGKPLEYKIEWHGTNEFIATSSEGQRVSFKKKG